MEFLPLILILLPLVGSLSALGVAATWQKANFLFFSSLTLVTALLCFKLAKPTGFYSLFEFYWIKPLGITFSFGVDHVTLILVLITSLIFWGSSFIGLGKNLTSLKHNIALLLLLESFLFGVFLAADIILFYIFWELVMIPVLLLFFINRQEQRTPIYLYIYTLVGSLAMLLGIVLILFFSISVKSNDLSGIANYQNLLNNELAFNPIIWVLFAISFAIKAPLFPFHGWQPRAYQEAPTFLTAILAALLSKMGWYGFYRFSYKLSSAGSESWQLAVLILAGVGVVYGALLAWQSTDFKRLLAYSSLSHLNLMIFGIFSGSKLAVAGSLFFVIQHALIISGLFWLLQYLEENYEFKNLAEMSGIFKVLPIFSAFFMLFSLANIGLPGLSGFVGEFSILAGSFKFYPWLSGFVALVVVFSAVYQLTLIQSLLFGKSTLSVGRKVSFKWRWILLFFVFGLSLIVMGIAPHFLFSLLEGII